MIEPTYKAEASMSQSKSGSGKRDSNGNAEEWQHEAERLQHRANEFVRQRPLMALTMALAGGYIAGRILSRV